MHDLLATAREAAEAAAAVHLEHMGRFDPATVREKTAASDFVSHVDLEAQEAALEIIRSRHPGHRILAEEDPTGADPNGAGLRSDGAAGGGSEAPPLWIVDPLDGTTNYLHGHPFFAASVGAVIDGRPVVGAVTAPALGERWWGGEGLGAWCNGEPARPSRVLDLRSALVGTGFPFKDLPSLPRYLDQFAAVLRSTSGIRRTGSASVDFCYLASGRLDAFWELRLDPWDFAAGWAVLREAGGVATHVDGSPLPLTRSPVLAANGPVLHHLLEELLRSVSSGGGGEDLARLPD